jgi:hypothetical protein
LAAGCWPQKERKKKVTSSDTEPSGCHRLAKPEDTLNLSGHTQTGGEVSNAGRSVPNSRHAISFLVHWVLVNGMSSTTQAFQGVKGSSKKVLAFRVRRSGKPWTGNGSGVIQKTVASSVLGSMYYSGLYNSPNCNWKREWMASLFTCQSCFTTPMSTATEEENNMSKNSELEVNCQCYSSQI